MEVGIRSSLFTCVCHGKVSDWAVHNAGEAQMAQHLVKQV